VNFDPFGNNILVAAGSFAKLVLALNFATQHAKLRPTSHKNIFEHNIAIKR